MSYSITLKASDGTVTVDTVTGTVPDGTFGVNGHEDANYVNISVQRTRPDGSLVANATQAADNGAFPAGAAQ